MTNKAINESAAGELRSCLSSFFDGYLLPYTAQVKLMEQEPLLERVPSDSDYIRSVWQDVGDVMGAAMVQYAEEG